jgi:hypothetical protein
MLRYSTEIQESNTLAENAKLKLLSTRCSAGLQTKPKSANLAPAPQTEHLQVRARDQDEEESRSGIYIGIKKLCRR